MAEGGFSVRVRALANGAMVDASAINGLIHVSTGATPGALSRRTIPAANVGFSSGDATILVPISFGSFVRIEIDN